MRIGPASARPPDSTAERNRTDPREPAAPRLADATESLGNLQRRGPVKLRVGAVPFHARASIGPTAPDVHGPPGRAPQQAVLTGKQLSASRAQGMQQRLEQGTAMLTGRQHPPQGPQRTPHTLDAFRSPEACREAVLKLFGPQAGELAAQLLQHAAAAGARPLEQPLLLATALHGVCHQDHELAATLLGRLDGSRIGPPTATEATSLHRLQRALAATPAGMDALCALEGVAPAQRAAYRTALQVAHHLLARGVDPGGSGTASLDDFRRLAAADPASARPVGGRDDGPHQLAQQALLHAMSQLKGDTPLNTRHRAAYVAWRNGYTESGKGSDFEKTLQRLAKFVPYAERGQHGVRPRSVAGLANGIVRALAKPFGKQLSPMSQMREGAHGATLGELKAEQQAFQAGLRDAIAPVREGLLQQAQALASRATRTPADHRQLDRLLTRVATLDQWQAVSRLGIKPDAARVQQAAQALLPRHALDAREVQRELKDIGKLQLKTLQAWGTEALPAAERAAFATRMEQLGETATGKPARPRTFGIEDMRQFALKVVRGSDVARFSDGGTRGVQVAPAVNLADLQLPSVGIGPDVKLESGRHATVQFGVSSIGGEVFIGSERRRAGHLGVAAFFGWKLHEHAAAGVNAGGKWAVETLAGEGVAIRTRKGADPSWKEKSADVVNFLFDQVQPPAGGRRPADNADLWQRFADRFHDEPDVSVNWVSQQGRTDRYSASVGAGVRADIAGWRIGPAASAGVEHSRSTNLRDDQSGQWSSSVAAKGSRTQVNLSLSLAGGAPSLQPFQDAQGQPTSMFGVQSFSWPGATLLGVGVDLTWRGENGVTRLTQEQGRLSPDLSFQQREFATASDFVAHIERHRSDWEAQLGQRDAQGVLTGGSAALDAFLREVKSLPWPGNKTFIERRSLEPEVAGRVDAYNARAATLRGAGDVDFSRAPLGEAARGELQALENEVHRLLCDPASWRPARLYASETNSTLKESGIDFVLKLNGRGEASASRDLVALSADRGAAPALPAQQAQAGATTATTPVSSSPPTPTPTPAGTPPPTPAQPPTATPALTATTSDDEIRQLARQTVEAIFAQVAREAAERREPPAG